jgi:DNA processing protein
MTCSPEELFKSSSRQLYISGNDKLLENEKRIAIIGSRNVSIAGAKRAKRFTEIVVKRGYVTISGLANGVDTIVHETTIENSGDTIAVLGTSLDKFYPYENMDLQKLIMEKHLAVSQFPTGTRIKRENFVLRNATMASISNGVIVIEAKAQSGSISMAWTTIKLKKPLFLLKSVIDGLDPVLAEKLMQQGATIVTDENVNDLF